MIRFLQNSEIDRPKWDECIEHSSQGLVYGLSWYLDLVSPGWCGLAEDDYSAVMPLPAKKKYGISYVIQPLYAQQLGVFSPEIPGEVIIAEFIKAIPGHFKYIALNLNFENRDFRDHIHSFSNNYELSLENSYDSIFEGYASNTKRNIQKAIGLNISFDGNVDELVQLKAENTAKSRKKIPSSKIKEFVKAVMDHGAGFICTASLDNIPCASVFFLHNKKRIYYLIPVSNPAGKDKKAMFAIIDLVIQKFAGSRLVLDFEGSNINGIARFFEGFGAVNRPYPNLRINRLPFPLNQFRKS